MLGQPRNCRLQRRARTAAMPTWPLLTPERHVAGPYRLTRLGGTCRLLAHQVYVQSGVPAGKLRGSTPLAVLPIPRAHSETRLSHNGFTSTCLLVRRQAVPQRHEQQELRVCTKRKQARDSDPTPVLWGCRHQSPCASCAASCPWTAASASTPTSDTALGQCTLSGLQRLAVSRANTTDAANARSNVCGPRPNPRLQVPDVTAEIFVRYTAVHSGQRKAQSSRPARPRRHAHSRGELQAQLLQCQAMTWPCPGARACFWHPPTRIDICRDRSS